MKVTKLKIPFQEVKQLFQFSDVHIRLNSRFEEYKEVFKKLYQAASELDEQSLIVCCGDVFHGKVNLSPESISLARELLKTLTEIRPVILIPGNHDGLVNNKSRMDSLSPVVSDIANLHYLKNSGLYGAGNILFNHFSAFDQKEKYILTKDIPKDILSQYSKLVGLYHGPVCGMTTALGHVITDIKVTPDMFEGQDFALLGDIHREQDVFVEKVIDESELEEYKEKGWEVK